MIGFLTSNLSVGVSGSCQEGSITCRFQIGNLGINVWKEIEINYENRHHTVRGHKNILKQLYIEQFQIIPSAV